MQALDGRWEIQDNFAFEFALSSSWTRKFHTLTRMIRLWCQFIIMQRTIQPQPAEVLIPTSSNQSGEVLDFTNSEHRVGEPCCPERLSCSQVRFWCASAGWREGRVTSFYDGMADSLNMATIIHPQCSYELRREPLFTNRGDAMET